MLTIKHTPTIKITSQSDINTSRAMNTEQAKRLARFNA